MDGGTASTCSATCSSTRGAPASSTPRRRTSPDPAACRRSSVKVTAVELRRIRMPLVSPFRTSFGTATSREVLLVRVVTPESEGWGECVAMEEPLYSYEDVETAAHVLRSQLVPRVLAVGERLTAARVGHVLEKVKGHPMAKAALELAVLDAELRACGRSFGNHVGAVKDTVPAGVSVGIMDSVPQLLDAVGDYVDQGY